MQLTKELAFYCFFILLLSVSTFLFLTEKEANGDSDDIPIRSFEESVYPLSFGSDGVNDFSFLKDVIGDSRMVFLGETSHGVGEFHDFYTKVIPYLHSEMDFEVVAFESDMAQTAISYANASINDRPQQLMGDGVLHIWQTLELMPLFEYIQEKKDTTSPLHLAGFDIQPHRNEVYGDFLGELFENIDAQQVPEIRELERMFNTAYYRDTELNSPDLLDHLMEGYKEVLTFMAENEIVESEDTDHLAILRVSMEERLNTIEHLLPLAEPKERYAVRDKGMARQLTWLSEEMYPDKKIIVLAHGDHVRKNNSRVLETNTPSEGLKLMGELLPTSIREVSYTIGLFMHSGSAERVRNQFFTINDEHEEGDLEWMLNKSEQRGLFLPVKGNRSLDPWLIKPVRAKNFGLTKERFLLHEQYDGIVYVDRVRPVKYLSSAR
ncbi:erythromycin esterase family protein [Alteribacter aurantiacus]|uniref:erythromycin esterase family protein n=1 Tax=Alteribacter aurantiacus TaxID=254410 RepID=UPI0004022C7B|nr:erythromycin esterase family protein [Alteribacter aurantiacus]